MIILSESFLHSFDISPHPTQVDATRFENGVEKATAYLESKYKDYSTNAYVLSIISYAFFKAESPQLNAVLFFLQSLAINEGTDQSLIH